MYSIKSVAKGRTVPMQEVKDPVFSEEVLGKGVAVIPEDGKIYAPADGEITMICDTGHAFSMKTDYGAELLVHIGIDTVKLKGKGFSYLVKTGDKVKEGQQIAKVNLLKLKWAGYDPVTPVIVCNWEDFQQFAPVTGEKVNPGDEILRLL